MLSGNSKKFEDCNLQPTTKGTVTFVTVPLVSELIRYEKFHFNLAGVICLPYNNTSGLVFLLRPVYIPALILL